MYSLQIPVDLVEFFIFVFEVFNILIDFVLVLVQKNIYMLTFELHHAFMYGTQIHGIAHLKTKMD